MKNQVQEKVSFFIFLFLISFQGPFILSCFKTMEKYFYQIFSRPTERDFLGDIRNLTKLVFLRDYSDDLSNEDLKKLTNLEKLVLKYFNVVDLKRIKETDLSILTNFVNLSCSQFQFSEREVKNCYL